MKTSISDISSINNNDSEKAKSILEKNISDLSFKDLGFLIRENIETRICVFIALKRLKTTNLKLPIFYRDSDSENQRELTRELILIHSGYWDIYPNDFNKLKDIIVPHLDGLNLPEFIKETFKSYEPKKLIWNNAAIERFGQYMNDSRMGVICGYNMVTSMKSAILNGAIVNYNIDSKEIQIESIDDFEKLILSDINCNDELKERLREEENKANMLYKIMAD